MKRALILASVASMIEQFNLSNIELLQNMGYRVDIACNFKTGSTYPEEKAKALKEKLWAKGVHSYQIDFARNITCLRSNIKAFWQVEQLLQRKDYCFLHCHSPIGGVIGRIAGWRTHTKVLYTAHGFHFYRGAPKKNWLFYYPIERLCSYRTDLLITINQEDYDTAKRLLRAKKVAYIPGIGFDVANDRARALETDRKKKRAELGIKPNTIMLLSVGELIPRKNHREIIAILSGLGISNIKYVICGKGVGEKELRKEAERYEVRDKVCLLGFRTDIRGNNELIENGVNGTRVQIGDKKAWIKAIKKWIKVDNNFSES